MAAEPSAYAVAPQLDPLGATAVHDYLTTVLPAEVLDHFGRYQTDPKWAEVRRRYTRSEPLLFGLTYFPHHLTDEQWGMSLSPFHVDLCDRAKVWMTSTGFREHREAFAAPRGSGKSTWMFLVLPVWAGAHQHRSFIACFADSPSQATRHLLTIRRELDTNRRVRCDYPAMCRPAMRARGTSYSDRQDEIIQESGLIITGRGIDSKMLGMKIGERRPDLLIIDDPEPQESSYSPAAAEKRKSALLDVVLPLNDYAAVAVSGTVTMPDSLVHQLVRPAYEGADTDVDWCVDARFQTYYYPAIHTDSRGVEHSLWPDKYPLEQLLQFRHTREFAKNMMNRPVAVDGDYWRPEDIAYDQLPGYGRTILQIDPAVTAKDTSDYYGFAIVSRSFTNERWRVWVRSASHAKLTPADFRLRVLALLEEHTDIGLVRVESNQGGDLWAQILHDLPVKLRSAWTDEPKPVKFARAHQDYQAGRVFHTERFPQAEDEMLSYPNVLNDDVVDAVAQGVLYFLDSDRLWRRNQKETQAKSGSYV